MLEAKDGKAMGLGTLLSGGGQLLVLIVLLVLLLLLILSLLPAPGTPKWFAYMVSAKDYLWFDLFFAESEFRDLTILDKDNDGSGEFGALADLLPLAARIGATRRFKQPNEFRPEVGEAKICWDAYLLRVYVPRETDMREHAWCAVAWPASSNTKALYTLVFYVNPDFARGEIGVVKDPRYCGWGNGPELEEIFVGEPFSSNLNWKRWKKWADRWQP